MGVGAVTGVRRKRMPGGAGACALRDDRRRDGAGLGCGGVGGTAKVASAGG